ncbi:MAG: thiamine pyrophosphate-binding protein [Gemmatimonadetes bacterium]|nr:thiamine pyrophosphate-binding protein [Gemmatimonadota bacterium]NIU77763.1 thiamine pyrophosphate-binding protein [Gammaproteobacteria bacterium]NIX46901.1 thiamine pyrophosphate-binding protein [Gemmatimonadota bacterium]NIY11252.1 thiamine pyrophosphate-binding protein [Gemmatimonadota bacterium]
MGHAADLALGIALARPDRRVICLNGDASMLMSLGTLATIVESGVSNLSLIVVNNGVFELTGAQPVAGAGRVRFAGVARASGFGRVHSCRTPVDYRSALDDVFGGPGPVLVEAHVQPGDEGPISRGPGEEAEYLRSSLHDSARVLRRALGQERSGGPASPTGDEHG